MKKLLLFTFSILLFTNSYSTHLMGGQITVTQLNGYDYIVELNAYRDTMGIPMASSATFSISTPPSVETMNTNCFLTLSRTIPAYNSD